MVVATNNMVCGIKKIISLFANGYSFADDTIIVTSIGADKITA